MIIRGKVIYDLGPDFRRRARSSLGPSVFYIMEFYETRHYSRVYRLWSGSLRRLFGR